MKTYIEYQRPLTIYKASAGSGKTFTLTVEYIKLLILNPLNYSRILAVTFTKKATEEMRSRILSQLYGISRHLEDSQSYLKRLEQETNLSPLVIQERAGLALNLLLHDFGRFRIETIDSFFQEILRNLSRELDLTPNLRIELNDEHIKNEAVDIMVEELDEKSPTLQLILDFIHAKLNENRSWKVINDIKKFSQNIFKDIFKPYAKDIYKLTADNAFMEQYNKELQKEALDAKAILHSFAEKFFEVLNKNNLEIEDLSYGTGGAGSIFQKIKDGKYDKLEIGKRAEEALNDPDKWATKKSLRCKEIISLAENVFNPLLSEIKKELPKQKLRINSTEITCKNLYLLRLLASIEHKVRLLNEQSSRFLLSDTAYLLRALISNDDSPFIFEKTGSRLEYLMIDEFQDTATIPWYNFKVLLEECMSHAKATNLIVGDVKQSIYRWRDGDWRLLNDIEKQFNNPNERLDIKTLSTNFRSSTRVITFNNTFFEVASKIESETRERENQDSNPLLMAYEDVIQNVPKDTKESGYVKIKLFGKEDKDEQLILKETEMTIKELLNKGEKPENIAILLRRNEEISRLVEYLITNIPDIKIMSSEAFKLESSIVINTMVDAMRFLIFPQDRIIREQLTQTYRQIIQKSAEFVQKEETDLKDELPEEFVSNMYSLLTMPLHNLAEKIYEIFKLDQIKGQEDYVCTFFDVLSDFVQTNSADISDFINEWDNTLHNKTIQTIAPNGIQLMTIHKSKGLEFNTVIIPYCDWNLNSKDTILWVKPTEEPYNKLPIIPINYSTGKLMDSIYARDAVIEHMQITVDNLNLLYVAFTRAKNNLIVIAQQKDKKDSRFDLLLNCLPVISKKLNVKIEGYNTTLDDKNLTFPIKFEYGEITLSTTNNEKKNTSNILTVPPKPLYLQVNASKYLPQFVQSKATRDFIQNEDEAEQSVKQQEYINKGSIMHAILSRITTTKDLKKVISEMQEENTIDLQTAMEASELLTERFKDERIANWFSDKWHVYNECSILSPFIEENKDDKDDKQDKPQSNTSQRRPDRVMESDEKVEIVDFKFGKQRENHKEQVKEYVSLLKLMGYKYVKGYVWYVYDNVIIAV